MKQYKTKGPVTNTLLPVVALDDAVALIAYGLSMLSLIHISQAPDANSDDSQSAEMGE